MQLGKLGVWAAMDVMSAADGAAFAQRVEGWAMRVVAPEAAPHVLVQFLLAARQHQIADRRAGDRQHLRARRDGDGKRPARPCRSSRAVGFFWGSACRTAVVEGVRGHTYGRPVATMRAYSRRWRGAYGAPSREKPLTILAALGPRMLALREPRRRLASL